MSKSKRSFIAHCSECGANWQTETWAEVDEERDPDAVQMICDDLFFIHQCPHCGTQFKLADPVVYYNRHKRAMICFVDGLVNSSIASSHMQEIISEMNIDKTNFYVRLTTSMNDFREKVLLLKDNLDDRTIEVMKILGLETVRKEGYAQDFREIRCSINPANGKLAIDFCGDMPRNMQVNRSVYENLFKEMSKELAKEIPPLEVNADWAISFLETHS